MDIQKIPYKELKYLVTNDQLEQVISILTTLHGGSDPYECGMVDTIYYDTPNGSLYKQCLRGDAVKQKIRIRGYGDGQFSQLHDKKRYIDTVSKRKFAIQPLAWNSGYGPEWNDIRIVQQGIAHPSTAGLAPYYIPVVRVTYRRYRFRIKDSRLTLDTRIEVSAPENGWITRRQHGILANHVLELKTTESRPYLPLLGLVRLAPVNFSKFKLGLNLLDPIF